MQKPSLCSPCPLYRMGYSFSKPDGKGLLGVAIIGEALGDNEAVDGMPFRPKAAAGSKLEEVFRLTGYTREQFLLWNLVACQPPANHLLGAVYEDKAVSVCGNHFERVVGGFRPAHFKRTILGLGNIPLKHLAGQEIGQKKRGIAYMRGYVLRCKYGPYVGSLHPAFIRRGFSHYTPYLVHDLEKAIQIANGSYTDYLGHPDFKMPEYREHPSLDEAWSYYYMLKDNSRRLITYDIETLGLAEMDEDERDDYEGGTEIEQIQFSHKRRYGIAFPWQHEFKKIAKKILALPNDKANHNTWNFDNPILRSKGISISGRVDDTLWMFKHYHPALDRNLQSAASLVNFPFPWKQYFGEKLEWYGCADVDAVQWLMHPTKGLPQLMKDRGVWGGYDRHVYEIHLELDKASNDRGIPINADKHTKLEEQLKDRLKIVDKECQELVPLSLRNVIPRNKNKATGDIRFGYIRQPKQIDMVVAEWQRKRERVLAKGIPEDKIVAAKKYVYLKTGMVKRLFTDPDGVERRRWCKVLPFKPNSSKQVIKYIKWKRGEVFKQLEDTTNREERAELKELAKGYEVPMTIARRGEESKETTGKEALKELVEATGDELLGKTGEFRSLKKMITNDLPNWLPIHTILKDGEVEFDAVKATWGFTAPTGQLDTRSPNIQNASKHTPLGDLFRQIIEAPVGYRIVEFDFKSFHVALMGWRANDPTYIRFSQLDPHSIFASYLDGIPAGLANVDFSKSDSEILEICREIKNCFGELRQRVAKPAVLGNQLGLGPNKLWLQNKKFITSLDMAKELQARLAQRFDKVAKVKEEITETADRQGYLLNKFERIQYFYDVFTFSYRKRDERWVKGHGTDTEKCLAFEVQSNAFGKVMEDILECRNRGYNDRYNFINTIHDSLVFMPRVGDLDRCISDIVPVLTRPCDKLWVPSMGQGLSVGVEVAVGRNMGKWKEGSNKEGMREVKI